MSGWAFRTLTIPDDYNCEASWIELDMRLPAERVIRVLVMLLQFRPAPWDIRLDNGPKFVSKWVATLTRRYQAELVPIKPDKLVQIV